MQTIPTPLFLFGATYALSLVLCWTTVWSFTWHARFTADAVGLGAQNRHGSAVPRVGGAALALAAALGIAMLPIAAGVLGGALLLSAAPALVCGLAEDMTRRVSPTSRLAATVAGAILAWHTLGVQVMPIGLPGVDVLLGVRAVSMLTAVVMIAGVANATNIIDGVNGLASGCLTVMAATVALVAWQVGDDSLAVVAGVLACATAGFLACNYPSGRIFLGDGGAYFGGTLIAVLALLLVQRNPPVSPLFPFALTVYPVIETLYSAGRRVMRRGRSPFSADRLHLHSLIQNRLLRCSDIRNAQLRNIERNARTAPYLWLVCLCGALPCAMAWYSSAALWAGIVASVSVYALLYRIVVRGCAPAWLRRESSHTLSPVDSSSVLD